MNDKTSFDVIPGNYAYWAFISYSHHDKAAGEWIHRALEAYRIPKLLRGESGRFGPVPGRLFPVFRDREELAASPDLGDRIQAALMQSRHLIVLCSPDAAASPWVNKEIVFFKSLGREEQIFSLIVAGEPYASEQPGRELDECFPEALRFRFGADGRPSSTRAEPLAADSRPDKDGRQNALLKLIAGMLDVGFDNLRQRDLEQRNARLRRVVGASALLVLIFAALSLYARNEQQRAEERSRVALSRQLAIQSGVLLSTSPDLPLMLSLEALLTQDTAEAKHSLFEALNVSRHPITLLRSAVKTNWNALVITRDGKAAITGGEGGQVAFWDIAGASAESPVVQSAHSGPVHDLALSNDGKLLASVGEDGVIRLWDVTARRPLEDQSIPKQPAPVTAVAFGPRDLLAFGTTVGDEPKIAITLWDLAARQPKATWNATSDGPVSNIKFSRDGSMLASVAVGGDTILWDVATGNQIHSDFLKDTDSLAFSPDGQWLASGSWQLTLRKVSDFAAVQFQLPDAPTHIDAVEFSPDGQLLASAAYSGNVMVWNAATRSPVEGPIQLNVGPIGSMAFGPGGNTLFATGREGEIAVIALGSAPLIRVLPTGTYIAGLAFSPSRGVLASNGDRGSVTLWDPLTLSRVAQTTPLHPELVHAVAFSRDGKVLASGSIKGQLAFWDPQTARQVAQPAKVASVAIERLSFSPDGSMLAIVPAGREVLLWDYRNHQSHPQILQADPKFVLDAVFTPDGARLVTAGDSGEIIEWDWRTGQRIGSPIKIGAGVDALAFSPDGKLLSAGDYDGHVTLWDLAHRKRIGEPLIGHTNFVRAVAFSPDSKSLASGGDDGAAILWDLASHQAIARFRHGATVLSGDQTARTPLAVNHVAFSSDGKMLAADGPENRILLWDVDIHSWELQACRQTNRNLTEEEWKRYVGEDVSYRETCPQGMPRMDGTRKRFWIW